MSDYRRIIEIYLDTEGQRQVTSDNYDVEPKMVLFRGSQILIRAHLRLADGTTYFAPDASATWNFNIDSVYTADHSDLVASDNDQFNIGADWDDLDVTGGKICWRVDTTSTALETDLGDDESKTMYAELWMTPPATSSVLVCHWDITMHNIATDIAETSDLVYTSTSMLRYDGDDIILIFADGTEAQRWSLT